MKKIHLALIGIALSLPMASFAYAEGEWDDFFRDSKPRSLLDVGKTKPYVENTPAKERHLQQAKRLDQEILILRAEMSKKNGDQKQVAQYLKELKKQYIIPAFQNRVAELEKYLASVPKPSLLSFFSFSKDIVFPMQDPQAVVAIVLPTSGRFQQVGLELQNTLQRGLKQAGFKGKLIALDSGLYSSAFEMWEVLKYYEPDFIFGPLQKERILQWQQLATGVSTLYFNEVGSLSSSEYSLSPSKQAGLEQVFQVLNQAQYQKILVLKNRDDVSEQLEQAFHQAWSQFNNPNDYHVQTIDKTVGQVIDDALHSQNSKERHQWLQTVLRQPLEFEPRARKDIEAVISFVPENQAIQIAPYLHFLSLNQTITHIWYPSKTPSQSYLSANRDAWVQTFAILPLFFSSEFLKNQTSTTSIEKNGLFHALGEVAIEIVKNPSESSKVDTLVESAFGTYVRDANGQFYLLPTVYWADNGVFERFTIQSE
ncbi:hypothetical protein THMIRHAM_07360 [Thiomicrorhabdus immobilis]|uniref:Uncharacterized protein n=1 Tax=Thiomicrorhabdus immobilis TaxID=2791037 RepID=A0ABM7MC50_9GAMM|nr:penicillin-binding protein activator [Thiomicrorhabdus immobilis]BCN92951.1 hypothetical protein THMIRHAM_07360 [Thiomicrorhabdus immobilis]